MPVAWGVEINPSLRRAAEVLHRWREHGQIGENQRFLPPSRRGVLLHLVRRGREILPGRSAFSLFRRGGRLPRGLPRAGSVPGAAGRRARTGAPSCAITASPSSSSTTPTRYTSCRSWAGCTTTRGNGRCCPSMAKRRSSAGTRPSPTASPTCASTPPGSTFEAAGDEGRRRRPAAAPDATRRRRTGRAASAGSRSPPGNRPPPAWTCFCSSDPERTRPARGGGSRLSLGRRARSPG